jgi:hypothetical protein
MKLVSNLCIDVMLSLTQCTKVGSTREEGSNRWQGEKSCKCHTKQIRSRHGESTTHNNHFTGKDKDEECRSPVDNHRKHSCKLDDRRTSGDKFKFLFQFPKIRREKSEMKTSKKREDKPSDMGP